MNETFGGVLASRSVPPWLPRDAQDARLYSFWAQVIFFLMALIWFVIGIAWIVAGFLSGGSGVAFGFVGLIIAVICGIAGIYLKKSVIDDIDHGHFHEAKIGCVAWGLIGITGFVIPTILLLLAWMKLSDVLSPQQTQYSPYYQTPAQGQPPQQQPPPAQPPQQAPGARPTPPPAQAKEKKYQMMKCKNCNVQFPAFMATCPNCGAPKE